MDKQRQLPGDRMPHGLMFHYFHDGRRYPAGQGTLSDVEFEEILDRHLAAARLLQAREWAHKAENASLQTGEVCVTFDDTLRSQFDIALPVLRRKGLTAFWFVQSGVLNGEEVLVEAFRHFRNAHFSSMAEFYQAFFASLPGVAAAETVRRAGGPIPNDYLQELSFYTPEDRKFRYIRDRVLQPHEYFGVMKHLIQSMGTSVEELSKGLLLDSECLQTLEREGHIIGLHSHSHPTCLADLPEDAQRREYETNYSVLCEILAEPPFTMAHPCNSYSTGTLEILRSLGIRIGFRSNMAMPEHSGLEFPRKDSAYLLSELDQVRHTPR